MRLHRLAPAFLLLVAVSSFAQTTPANKPGPGFSIDNIDKSVDPCTDFYQYACGNWLKNTEIPSDQPEWLSFADVDQRNKLVLKDILEKPSVVGASRSAVDQKIGDYYSACMDEKSVDAEGLDPLKPELARIAGAQDKPALIDVIARVHLMGPNPLFNFYSSPDLHNADQVIADIDQGGLTLP